jgi:hypothetical protein
MTNPDFKRSAERARKELGASICVLVVIHRNGSIHAVHAAQEHLERAGQEIAGRCLDVTLGKEDP